MQRWLVYEQPGRTGGTMKGCVDRDMEVVYFNMEWKCFGSDVKPKNRYTCAHVEFLTNKEKYCMNWSLCCRVCKDTCA